MSNKIVKKAFIVLVVLFAFFFGYEISFFPQMRKDAHIYAQDIVQYKRCYAIKTSVEGYKEFNEGEINEDEALVLPSGWIPVGFTGNNANMFTLLCQR